MAFIEYDFIAFEWDDNKSLSNETKHGLSFETAHYAFFDANLVMVKHQVVGGEQRFKTLARVNNSTCILFVGHLYQEDEKEYIRIITARLATNQEEREYYDKLT